MKKPKAQKSKRLLALDIGVAVVAVALVAFGLWNSFNPGNQPACKQIGQEHQVTVMNDEFSVKELTLKQCDTVKIVNFDSQNYEFAFGVHDKHIDYPGFSRQLVAPNEFLAIDALEAGDFRIHDHLRDKAAIELHILPKD